MKLEKYEKKLVAIQALAGAGAGGCAMASSDPFLGFCIICCAWMLLAK